MHESFKPKLGNFAFRRTFSIWSIACQSTVVLHQHALATLEFHAALKCTRCTYTVVGLMVLFKSQKSTRRLIDLLRKLSKKAAAKSTSLSLSHTHTHTHTEADQSYCLLDLNPTLIRFI
eukprot:COSAG06_NODE_4_length_41837_cov_204.557597_42_plen_119_part_00